MAPLPLEAMKKQLTPIWVPIPLGALLLAAGAFAVPSAQAEDAALASSPKRSELRMHASTFAMRTADAFPVVDVLMNGQGPYPFAVDLSLGRCMVDRTVAETVGVKPGAAIRFRNPLGAGFLEGAEAEVELVETGHMMLLGLPVVVADLSAWSGPPDGPRGSLSAGAFAGYLLRLNLASGQVTIRKGELPAPDASEIFEAAWDDSPPLLPLKVTNARIVALLDFGYPKGILLPGSFARELGLSSEPPAQGGEGALDVEPGIHAATLDGDAVLGGLVLPRPEIRWGEAVSTARVGREILARLDITLDPANRRVRLRDANEKIFRAPPGRTRYGLKFEKIGGTPLTLSGVASPSVAARAGLRQGDEILELNGAPAGSLSEELRVKALQGSPLRIKLKRGAETIQVTLAFSDD